MEENISQKEKEKAEEEMIEQAFQELLNVHWQVPRSLKESSETNSILR